MSNTYSPKTYLAAFGVGALLMAFGLFAFTQMNDSETSAAQILETPDVSSGVQLAAADGPREMTVYKSATCGCCKSWIDYLEKAGYTVTAVDREDMAMVKAKYGIPRNVQSCHTGIINGYVVEGHVPVEDIERMLAAKPDAVGISAPGMPVGSPGMEQGNQKDPYDVVAFRSSGEVAIFASYNK
ncbi:MAG: DUF411 domain-containing protein [Bacteroidetes bacterium]|nr:DUF411 domain-containing protein [Bacteroidota bacterium]